MAQRVVIPFKPWRLQKEIEKKLAQFGVLVCHRRFGKTLLGLNLLLKRGIQCPHRNPRMMYVAPLRVQAREIAWEWLKHFTHNIPGATPYESRLQVEIPRDDNDKLIIGLYGADKPSKSRGPYADGVVLDEYADMDPSMWSKVVMPMLANPGRTPGWALFTGTPAGENHFYDRYQRAKESMLEGGKWVAFKFKASETNILSPEFLEECKADMDPDEYAQEFECKFVAAVVGSYYAKILDEMNREGKLSGARFDPSLPVHTSSDIGVGPNMVVGCFQIHGNEVRMIDVWQGESSDGIPEACLWLNSQQYNYGTDFLPHDIEHTEAGTGRTRMETWMKLRRSRASCHVLPKLSVDDGINATRIMLPRFRFADSQPGVEKALKALRHYRRKWVEKDGIFRPAPHGDWASHFADMVRYACLGLREERDEPLQTHMVSSYDSKRLYQRHALVNDWDPRRPYDNSDADEMRPHRPIQKYYGD